MEKSQANMANDPLATAVEEAPSISGLYELAIGATAEDEAALIQYWQQFGFSVVQFTTLSATQANQLYGVNSSLRSLRLHNQVKDRGLLRLMVWEEPVNEGLLANIIISNASLRNRFKFELSKAGLVMTNTFSIEATIAAYRYGEPWLEALNSYLHQNFKFLVSFVRDQLPQVNVVPLEGTYLVWLDFRGMGCSDDEIKETLLNRAKVWLSDGPAFGKGGEGFQRINIATPREVLESGLKRIAKAFADN